MLYCIVLLYIACISTDALSFTTTRQGITLNAHLMRPQECAEKYQHDLPAYHIYPIHIEIINNTEKTWLLSGNSIAQLSLIPPHSIARDIIFQHYSLTNFITYTCALAAWASTFAGMQLIHESLPKLADWTHHVSSTVALISFLYKAHMINAYRSTSYTRTHTLITEQGLSSQIILIPASATMTKVMFLNDKSYEKPPTLEHTFYYLFTVNLYNLQDSIDIVTLPVEIPKIYIY